MARKEERLEEQGSEEFRHYGFTWFAVHTFVGVIGFFALSWLCVAIGCTLIIASAGDPLACVVWLIAFPFLIVGVYMVGVSLNYATPVTLDTNGIWIKYFLFWKRFIPWEDVKSLVHNNLGFRPNRVVVRYISPFHWLVGDPLHQSFNLVFGLKDKDELFWEIQKRASLAQNQEVPVEENWWN